jgi:GNAT superfamily N-acetyltransferase
VTSHNEHVRKPGLSVTLVTLWTSHSHESRCITRTEAPAPPSPLYFGTRFIDSGTRTDPRWEPMMELTLDMDLLVPADWRVLRAARLNALLDSPRAFTSTYAHESDWGEFEWRRVFDAATCIVAREAVKVIGLAKSVAEPLRPWMRHLESIWVAPTHRRRGVFRALLGHLAEIDHRTGVTDLMLWVLEDNYDAQRAYYAVGFEPTGERQFLPALGRFERRLRVDTRCLLDS